MPLYADKYIDSKIINNLNQLMAELGKNGLCLAFSGGVDSALLACIAANLKLNCHLVTFKTELHPAADIKEARNLAEQLGLKHVVIEINELEDERIIKNPPERCYYCKHLLFTKLKEYATANDLDVIIDGTNADDLNEYRPGLKALKELHIISPLAELNINKETVRSIAKELNLRVHNKPSSPCLATRFPYHTTITRELLNMANLCEEYLKSLGILKNRVRIHGDIARIEVDVNNFNIILEQRENISKQFKNYGLSYVTLDIEGFRSGSMDIYLRNNDR